MQMDNRGPTKKQGKGDGKEHGKIVKQNCTSKASSTGLSNKR
jgi:hypothetical protein